MPAKKDSDSSPVKKGSRKAKSTDDKPKVKRAPSAYIVFCTEKRTEAKESNPDASFGELGKILGQMWGQLDDKGKEVRALVINLTSDLRSPRICSTTISNDTYNFQSNHAALRKDFRSQKGGT